MEKEQELMVLETIPSVPWSDQTCYRQVLCTHNG